jgi:hypothetical protein
MQVPYYILYSIFLYLDRIIFEKCICNNYFLLFISLSGTQDTRNIPTFIITNLQPIKLYN